jgi:hypothetical protein
MMEDGLGAPSEAVRPWSSSHGVRAKENSSYRILGAGLAAVAMLACCAAVVLSGSGPKVSLASVLSNGFWRDSTFAGRSNSLQTAVLQEACSACAHSILSQHLPWQQGSVLDAEDAMSCSTEGACSAASKQAAEMSLNDPGQHVQQLAEINPQLMASWAQKSAHQSHPVNSMSKEQFAYDSRML